MTYRDDHKKRHGNKCLINFEEIEKSFRCCLDISITGFNRFKLFDLYILASLIVERKFLYETSLISKKLNRSSGVHGNNTKNGCSNTKQVSDTQTGTNGSIFSSDC